MERMHNQSGAGPDEDMLQEYDFSDAEAGKYVGRYQHRINRNTADNTLTRDRAMTGSLSTQEINKRSVALVEQQLIRAGVGPFRRSPDHTIHLVWRAPTGIEINVQVRGNAKPKPGGGKGKLALDWWIDERSPADVIALVDLSTDRVWLMSLSEIEALAQQHSGGRHHLYMYVDPSAVLRRGNYDTDFRAHLLDQKVASLFKGL
jgi:hypothetical protein